MLEETLATRLDIHNSASVENYLRSVDIYYTLREDLIAKLDKKHPGELYIIKHLNYSMEYNENDDEYYYTLRAQYVLV